MALTPPRNLTRINRPADLAALTLRQLADLIGVALEDWSRDCGTITCRIVWLAWRHGVQAERCCASALDGKTRFHCWVEFPSDGRILDALYGEIRGRRLADCANELPFWGTKEEWSAGEHLAVEPGLGTCSPCGRKPRPARHTGAKPMAKNLG